MVYLSVACCLDFKQVQTSSSSLAVGVFFQWADRLAGCFNLLQIHRDSRLDSLGQFRNELLSFLDFTLGIQTSIWNFLEIHVEYHTHAALAEGCQIGKAHPEPTA